jgi:hypothetical protein
MDAGGRANAADAGAGLRYCGLAQFRMWAHAYYGCESSFMKKTQVFSGLASERAGSF